ncbi:MAG: 16S rRNA (guanine(527)-N(7))-methyltransferase RsmG [Chloroflexi bacterium]|nr:16S rRNA (guanine(527)-N(7))-methyltransferase RsmG [Chloroflexota bacterium]
MTLREEAQQLFDIPLTDGQLEQFKVLVDELLDWNASRVNLTAITDRREIEVRHLLDSLSLLKYIDFPQNATVVDVGTGAGFPGFPLYFIRPDLHVTFIESVGKKTAFIEHIADKLHLENITILMARAEEAGQNSDYRAAFDIVTARALAYLPTLAEYLLPLCKVGGKCVAMKGKSTEREIEDAGYALEILGGKVSGVHEVRLPEVENSHYLVVIDKISPTPDKYPRRAGMPSKRPLS